MTKQSLLDHYKIHNEYFLWRLVNIHSAMSGEQSNMCRHIRSGWQSLLTDQSTNSVEDIDYLLPVKFHHYPINGGWEATEPTSAKIWGQGDRLPSLSTDKLPLSKSVLVVNRTSPKMRQPIGCHICWWIGPKSIKVVENVMYFLRVNVISLWKLDDITLYHGDITESYVISLGQGDITDSRWYHFVIPAQRVAVGI